METTMKLNTTYGLNDKVFPITLDRKREYVPCAACNGMGEVQLADGEKHQCPVCYGSGGHGKWLDKKWHVGSALTIGQVQIEATNIVKSGMFDNIGQFSEGRTKIEERYMAYETGIGSGTLYYGELLFATEVAAQAECDKRNQQPKPV